MLWQACDATREAAIHLFESAGFDVKPEARRDLHRRLIIFVGDASFATRGWARGHRAAPVKQVGSTREEESREYVFVVV